MELHNEFSVSVPIEQAWTVLTDIERIAPCMPGAQLREIEGDEYRGSVKVKVGPITAEYRGAATFVEQDSDTHRAVLRAEGRDTRGQGNAKALITAALHSEAGGTKVNVDTDLSVTGRVAQFGRGVLADVSAKLLNQFVQSLETSVLSESSQSAQAPATGQRSGGESASGASAEAAPASSVATSVGHSASTNGEAAATPLEDSSRLRTVNSSAAQPVDLLEVAGSPVMKRLLPAVGGLALLGALAWFFTRRRK